MKDREILKDYAISFNKLVNSDKSGGDKFKGYTDLTDQALKALCTYYLKKIDSVDIERIVRLYLKSISGIEWVGDFPEKLATAIKSALKDKPINSLKGE